MKRTITTPPLPDSLSAFFPLLVFLSFLFFNCSSGSLLAQTGSEKESVFDYLSNNGDLIDLVVQTDMEELINNRIRVEYQPAKILYRNQKKEKIQLEVEIIPRGNYRRRICDFPPVLLNFSKTYLEEKGLNRNYDKMKLVSQCKEKENAQYVLLKEYLAYKMYNLLSDKSYRVQLAQITYQDNKGKHKDIEQFGILIEDTDEMAHRIGGLECECRNYPQDSIAMAEENTLSVFQYMIGNEDWSIPMLRNVKLVRPYDGGLLVPVPYDFDFSGLVNASYAIPRSQLGITNIRQRFFLGFPVSQEMLSETITTFELQRPQILSLIESFEELDKWTRKDAVKYFDAFFKKPLQRKLATEVLKKNNPVQY